MQYIFAIMQYICYNAVFAAREMFPRRRAAAIMEPYVQEVIRGEEIFKSMRPRLPEAHRLCADQRRLQKTRLKGVSFYRYPPFAEWSVCRQ